jgi:hypothetical protein
MMPHIESLSRRLSQAHQKMKLQLVLKCKRVESVQDKCLVQKQIHKKVVNLKYRVSPKKLALFDLM